MSSGLDGILRPFGLQDVSDRRKWNRIAVFWPDGSLRFLFPRDIRYNDVLRFMHYAPLQAFKWYLYVRLRLYLRVTSQRKVLIADRKLLEHLPDSIGNSIVRWSLFGGSPGLKRNAVLFVETASGQGYFYKRPVVNDPDRGMAEIMCYEFLRRLDIKELWVPSVRAFRSGLVLEAVSGRAYKKRDFPLVLATLQQLFQATRGGTCDSVMRAADRMLERAHTESWSDQSVCLSEGDLLAAYLGKLSAHLRTKNPLPAALAIGDFVPWNCFVMEQKLVVIDLEYSSRHAPAGYDICHFIYQPSAMASKSVDEGAIKAVLGRMYNEVASLTGSRPDQAHSLVGAYLLRHISSFLVQYKSQSTLHERAHFQLSYWTMTVKIFLADGGDIEASH